MFLIKFMHYLNRYGTGTLTDVFLDRVFQECLTYDGEMVGNFVSFVYSYIVDTTILSWNTLTISLGLLWYTCISVFRNGV